MKPQKDIMNSKKLRKLSDDFFIICDSQGNHFLKSERLNLEIRIKENGYIPRSGLLLANCLNEFDIAGKGLDIGTGEIGFLAYYMYAKGASKVIACDCDPPTINFAQYASPLAKHIIWLVSDVFSNIEERSFDYIVSNPPQMPMEHKGRLHDYGGYDGRDVILRILKNSPNYLSPNGKLFILCFDFLGVMERFNSEPSISEIALKNGLCCHIVAEYQRQIRTGGETEKNLAWIKKIYPKYKFQSTQGEFWHKIFILKLEMSAQ